MQDKGFRQGKGGDSLDTTSTTLKADRFVSVKLAFDPETSVWNGTVAVVAQFEDKFKSNDECYRLGTIRYWPGEDQYDAYYQVWCASSKEVGDIMEVVVKNDRFQVGSTVYCISPDDRRAVSKAVQRMVKMEQKFDCLDSTEGTRLSKDSNGIESTPLHFNVAYSKVVLTIGSTTISKYDRTRYALQVETDGELKSGGLVEAEIAFDVYFKNKDDDDLPGMTRTFRIVEVSQSPMGLQKDFAEKLHVNPFVDEGKKSKFLGIVIDINVARISHQKYELSYGQDCDGVTVSVYAHVNANEPFFVAGRPFKVVEAVALNVGLKRRGQVSFDKETGQRFRKTPHRFSTRAIAIELDRNCNVSLSCVGRSKTYKGKDGYFHLDNVKYYLI